MPASYSIDRDRRVVFSRGWGELCDADLSEHQATLRADPAFEPSFAHLCDLQEVSDESQVTVLGLRCLAGVDVFTPWARRAIVAPHPLTFGLARVFVLLRKNRGEMVIEVFRELPPARHWVGLAEVRVD